jgi:hypothetical protein
MLTSLLCTLMIQRWIWHHGNLCTTQHAHHDSKMFYTLDLLIASRGGRAWAEFALAEQHVLCKVQYSSC